MSLEQVGQLGPAAIALAAVVALIVGLAPARRRAGADRRGQWWKRAQWALDLTLEQDPHRRAVGLAALEVLATSDLARPEEVRLLEVAWRTALTRTSEPAAGESEQPGAGDDDA